MSQVAGECLGWTEVLRGWRGDRAEWGSIVQMLIRCVQQLGRSGAVGLRGCGAVAQAV